MGPQQPKWLAPIPSDLASDWNRITRPLFSITPGSGNTCSLPSDSPLFETVVGMSTMLIARPGTPSRPMLYRLSCQRNKWEYEVGDEIPGSVGKVRSSGETAVCVFYQTYFFDLSVPSAVTRT